MMQLRENSFFGQMEDLQQSAGPQLPADALSLEQTQRQAAHDAEMKALNDEAAQGSELPSMKRAREEPAEEEDLDEYEEFLYRQAVQDDPDMVPMVQDSQDEVEEQHPRHHHHGHGPSKMLRTSASSSSQLGLGRLQMQLQALPTAARLSHANPMLAASAKILPGPKPASVHRAAADSSLPQLPNAKAAKTKATAKASVPVPEAVQTKTPVTPVPVPKPGAKRAAAKTTEGQGVTQQAPAPVPAAKSFAAKAKAGKAAAQPKSHSKGKGKPAQQEEEQPGPDDESSGGDAAEMEGDAAVALSKEEQMQSGSRSPDDWPFCVSVSSLQLTSQECQYFRQPPGLKLGGKWQIEVAKMRGSLEHLTALLSSGSKVKDQEIKTDLTALKRLGNEKTDKRLKCEKRTGNEKFSNLCNAVREILCKSKDMRALCTVSGLIFLFFSREVAGLTRLTELD